MAAVQHRVGYLFACFLLLLVAAGVRALYLGGPHAGALRRAAQTQQLTTEVVPAQRGTITDRNGAALAISEPAEEIVADPYLVGDTAQDPKHRSPLQDAQQLAPLLGQTVAEVLGKLSEHTGFVPLAHALPYNAAHKLLGLRIPGVQGTAVMRRVYPRGPLAGQVLGLVGAEGKGLAGLEYGDNSLLSGRPGKRRVVSDAIGQPISISETPQHPGASIQLTLDANIQQRVEDELAAVGRAFRPKDATAIVMDPRSGAILAMASLPAFDPSDPSRYSKTELEAAIQDRAVGFDYEPGSTFKAVVVSGALQEGLITPETGFEIPDQIQVADRTIHDDTEHPGESLTTAQILAQSSNVGAIKIGLLLGASRFNSWVRRFGFGSRTGIGLSGEESGAVLALDHYSGSSMGNLPIGQGELVTPIQMASVYAAIANGGVLRTPHIVRSIDGRPVSEPRGRQVISAATASELRSMLRGVLGPDGTASQVSVPGYELAGKTGTANKIDPQTGEYSKSAYVASFVGFAPARDPKLLCAVIVDEPQTGSIYGGAVAAPAFGQIMEFALPYLGIGPN